MKKIIYLILLIIILHINLSAQEEDKINWKIYGLGGGGGQFTPSISPLDPDLMSVSCDMSGVYITTDGGNLWNMIDFRKLKTSIAAPMVFHPDDINIMWDDNGRLLKKTTDKGETWQTVWEMPSASKDLIVPPDLSSLKVLAAIGDDGLFVSSDGDNFSKVSDIASALYLDGKKNILVANKTDIWISKDECASFASITPPQFETQNGIIDIAINGNRILVLENTRLWLTTDDGNNWTTLIKSSDFNRGLFRFVRTGGDYVWVTTGGGGQYQPTALLSKNKGEDFTPVFFCNDSWDDTSNLERGWLSLDFNCGWGGAAIGFNIAPNNPQIALWTDYGRTLMTTDAGETWTAPYTKFADTGDRTEGKRWTSRGLEVTSSWDVFITDDDEDFIAIAYTDIGGAFSEDNGNSWHSTAHSGIPSEWINTTYGFTYDKENSLLWGAFSGRHDIPGGWSANYWKNEGKGGVAFSTNMGRQWTPLTDNGLINRPVTSVAVDFTSPADKRRIFAAVWSNGVWRSEDGGKTWQRTSEGLDCGDGTNSNNGPNTHVLKVSVHPDGTVFALKTKYLRDEYKIKNDAGLWRSTNHGEDWEFISSNVPECPPNPRIDLNGEHSWADAITFYLDPDDVNHIYVGAQNSNNGKPQGGLYETTDGGTTWKRIYQSYAIFDIAVKDNVFIIASSGEGILISEDNTATWTDCNFHFAHPTKITVIPDDSKLAFWVNTFGGGLWKAEFKDETGIDNEISNTREFRISPNPATDYINVILSEAKNPFLNVKIYDVLGNVVLTLTPALSLKGEGVRIDVSGLAKGVYFVRVGGRMLKFVKI
jgi:photosystem II stability/assembly factor-like uncharacterized protein